MNNINSPLMWGVPVCRPTLYIRGVVVDNMMNYDDTNNIVINDNTFCLWIDESRMAFCGAFARDMRDRNHYSEGVKDESKLYTFGEALWFSDALVEARKVLPNLDDEDYVFFVDDGNHEIDFNRLKTMTKEQQ